MANPKPPDKGNDPAGKTAARAQTSERKRWIKKTPLDVVAEQEDKLRTEVAAIEEELNEKRTQLQKFEAFRKTVESS